jgi:aryl-alcohol dehydrogenase-like predicted oxidoreductase
MEYNYLGETGLKVSNLCLGTMTFGKNPEDCNEETAHQIMDEFVTKGGNFIDTADIYTQGVSEEIIGRWLAKQPKRNKIILATKLMSVSILLNSNLTELSMS